ncbi:hypothetical protein [Micromonospora sp. WMMD987]|uniref:hypothetical protein n=1 Tax=Micromonospora sp. WMMD987 TaxID=3016089 RepID=UPI00249B831D|nr:hypothetical protein [Micromonospora sp. WMMD987]WFE97175.1 hypothetical protein O7612_10055 [Micromonospora sp. WMMD987]
MRTAEGMLTESGSVQPGVPIPPAPLGWPAALLRRFTVGSHRSSFAHARNVTLGWLVAASLAVIADRLLVDHVLATWTAVAMIGYTLTRAVALVIFERRQQAFERSWLEALSQLLRRHPFEVVALRVQVTVEETRSAVRTVDLTDPADVAWLLHQQADRGADVSPQARIEFGYWGSDGAGRGSDSVRRRLTDLQIRPVDIPITWARIRFPQARYVAVVGDTGSGDRWPGRVAHWSLSGPVQLTTARAT